jgi:hypothetical protein
MSEECCGGVEYDCECDDCRNTSEYQARRLQEALVKMGRVSTIASSMLASLPYRDGRKSLRDNLLDGRLRALLGVLGDARREMLEQLCELCPDCAECRI